MKIDLERQMDQCRRLSAEVLVNRATLEQLCIDTRGLLYMAQVVMTSMSSIMTQDMRKLVRGVLEKAAEAAKARQTQEPGLDDIEKECVPRVIGRVREFDLAWDEMRRALARHVAACAVTDP